MSEINDMLTKGELFAQAHVILALIATHPDIALLKQEFENVSERHVAGVLAGEQSDASIRAYEFSTERWKTWMDAADQRQLKQTSNGAPPP